MQTSTNSQQSANTDASHTSPDSPFNLTPPLGLKDKLVRFFFNRGMKDKHLRLLVRRYWPTMRVVIEGLQFDLHPADNTTERVLYMSRQLDERESLQALANEIKNTRTLIFDIGANCGLYSVYLSKAAGPGSELYAFEPSPDMAARLMQNLRLNDVDSTTTVHQVALAAERGVTTLHVHNRNHGQSSLRSLDNSSTAIEVEQRPLADYLHHRDSFDNCVIKIDVEGREDTILFPFFSTCPDAQLPAAVLIEMVLENCWTHDLRQQLQKRGYTVVFEKEGNALFKLTHAN
ncbi:MAG: FkbM family methyltransferase [Granulosicoccus sp.]